MRHLMLVGQTATAKQTATSHPLARALMLERMTTTGGLHETSFTAPHPKMMKRTTAMTLIIACKEKNSWQSHSTHASRVVHDANHYVRKTMSKLRHSARK